MFERQLMVQLQRVLRKTVHNFRSAHIGPFMLQRVVFLHVLTQILVGHPIIACGQIIFAQILVAYLSQAEGHLALGIRPQQASLVAQCARHSRHIAFLHILSNMNGVAIIHRRHIMVGHQERLTLCQILLRQGNAVEVEVHIGHVELTEIHVEAILLTVLYKQPFQLQELAKRLRIVFLVIVETAIVVQVISLHRQ